MDKWAQRRKRGKTCRKRPISRLFRHVRGGAGRCKMHHSAKRDLNQGYWMDDSNRVIETLRRGVGMAWAGLGLGLGAPRGRSAMLE